MNQQKNRSAPFQSIVYADCFSGISGDMFLAALIDVGLPEDLLKNELSKLAISGYQINISTNLDSGIKATRLQVQAKDDHHGRTWKDIRLLIEESSLNKNIKAKSLAVFSRLAEAEALIHGYRTEDVHFHEVGGIDSVIDIVGSAIGLDYFKMDAIISSPLPMPRGWVSCQHGELPLPAPAVCEILKGVPVYGVAIDKELVTPTGAALIKTCSREFGNFPPMTIQQVGYGSGSHKLPGNHPNLLRLIIGETRAFTEAQEVEVIETNLDDWSPEGVPYLIEKIFALQALDVSLVPIQMKKGRPGFLLRVIADPAAAFEIKRCILSETTAIGLRYRKENRLTLPRVTGTVPSPWGALTVKKVQTPAGSVLYPEYEACKKITEEFGVTLKEIYGFVSCCSLSAFTDAES